MRLITARTVALTSLRFLSDVRKVNIVVIFIELTNFLHCHIISHAQSPESEKAMRAHIAEMLGSAKKHIATVEHHSPSTETAIDQTLDTYLELASVRDEIEELQKHCKMILMNIAVETGTTNFEGSTGRAYTTKPGTTVRADVKALQGLAIRRPDIAAEINQCLEIKPTGGVFTIVRKKG